MRVEKINRHFLFESDARRIHFLTTVQPTSQSSAQIHDQQLWLRHLLNRVAQTLASQAGIFDATIRHVVDAKGGNVAGDQTADFKFVVGLKNEFGVAREKARL